MANKNDLDWWKKREPQKSEKSAIAATKRAHKPKKVKESLTKRGIVLRAIKHGTYIVVLIVALAVGTHFLLRLVTRHGAHCTVPHLEMLSMAEAERLAALDDLKLIINDSLYAPSYEGGLILDQLPKPGVVVKPGRTIYLTVNAMQRRMVDVPYVAERSLRQAKNMLDVAGLSIAELIYEDDLAGNYILSQYNGSEEVNADSNIKAAVGSGITLHVGRGDNDITITPLILGLTLREAQSTLWNSGLNVGNIKHIGEIDVTNHNQARVMQQSVRAEHESRLGDRVSIRLSLDHAKVDSLVRVYHDEVEQEKIALQAMKDSLEMLNKEEL